MEMSQARSCSGLGVRPTPNVGPCARAPVPISTTSGNALNVVTIGDAPIAGDVPRLNGVVEPRDAERRVRRLVEVCGDLGARSLHRTEFVGAARHDDGFGADPVPGKAEPGERHAL